MNNEGLTLFFFLGGGSAWNAHYSMGNDVSDQCLTAFTLSFTVVACVIWKINSYLL